MLALHVVLEDAGLARTVVFDEVDVGIDGAVADAVGARLHRLSTRRQVVCVTHLPQVAAYADRHYHVRKRVEGGRTRADVLPLAGRDRIDALARMLGGKTVTEASRRHAADLLAAAGRGA
jgi:DNA repair protein RecN (Recombination protein N)